MLVQRVVEVCDVGLMMLVVMDLHCLRVDIRLERREVVWQRGKRMSRFGTRPAGVLLCDWWHRVQSFRSVALKPRIARHGSLHILASADVLSSPPTGGARGGVSAALAALSGRHYVDRPPVLLQFRAGAVHGRGGPRCKEHRDAKVAAACSALVSRDRKSTRLN